MFYWGFPKVSGVETCCFEQGLSDLVRVSGRACGVDTLFEWRGVSDLVCGVETRCFHRVFQGFQKFKVAILGGLPVFLRVSEGSVFTFGVPLGFPLVFLS